jgi:hypothetical protein
VLRGKFSKKWLCHFFDTERPAKAGRFFLLWMYGIMCINVCQAMEVAYVEKKAKDIVKKNF